MNNPKPPCEVVADLVIFYLVINLTTKVMTVLSWHRAKVKEKSN